MGKSDRKITSDWRKKSPEVRLRDGIVAVVASLPERRFSGDIGELWEPVKEAVRAQQIAGLREAQQQGKNKKPDEKISWMGPTEAAFSDFVAALAQESLAILLIQRSYEMRVDLASGTVTIGPLPGTGGTSAVSK